MIQEVLEEDLFHDEVHVVLGVELLLDEFGDVFIE